MRYFLLFSFLAVIFFFAEGETLAECSHICPGCQLGLPSFEEDPDLGIITKVCRSAQCDVMPWCFEVIGSGSLSNIHETVHVTNPDEDFLTGPNLTISVTDATATICISGSFEIPIPLTGFGETAGQASTITIPAGAVKTIPCLGPCPCSGGAHPVITVKK